MEFRRLYKLPGFLLVVAGARPCWVWRTLASSLAALVMIVGCNGEQGKPETPTAETPVAKTPVARTPVAETPVHTSTSVPSNLVLKAAGEPAISDINAIALWWNDVDRTTAYVLERAASDSGPWSVIAVVDPSQLPPSITIVNGLKRENERHRDRGLVPKERYFYRLHACKDSERIGSSDVASAITPELLLPPGAPAPVFTPTPQLSSPC